MASDQSVRVKKLSTESRVPIKGSARAAGQDLYAIEGTDVPARGQAIVGPGIAIGLHHNTHGPIAPESSLAVKHQFTTKAGVIDCDYRGEVKVVLANLEDQPYRVEKGDWIAQLIIKKDQQQGTTRSKPVGRYKKRGSRVRGLQHHHGPRGQGPECQNTDGNQ